MLAIKTDTQLSSVHSDHSVVSEARAKTCSNIDMADTHEPSSNEATATDAESNERRKSECPLRPTALTKRASRVVHRGEAKVNQGQKPSERENFMQRAKSVAKRLTRQGTKKGVKSEGQAS